MDGKSRCQRMVGIRFKPTGKIYHFDPGAFVLSVGDAVVVETKQGFGLGTVASSPETIEADVKIRELKKVFRLANEQDFIQVRKNMEMEQTAHAYCLSCIKKLDLKMHLFSVESTFDGSKLTFFFTADGRVDFRQLVKMLVQKLGVRIEMRQVGIRHQAKICGGIGRCGRQICCSTFIEQFDPVSIRMAKEQNLSLNPTKISGQCGRLMCCLAFEYHTYKELRKQFPKIGKTVQAPQGKGRVVRHNTIGNRVTIRLEDKSEIDVDLESLSKEP
jgi:cell fate regulator YaaT (PSP1 superfamily)